MPIVDRLIKMIIPACAFFFLGEVLMENSCPSVIQLDADIMVHFMLFQCF